MTPNKHRIAHLTREEFRDRMSADPVILLPLGSLEQHGPGCPMGDFALAELLADAVAERLGALAGPTLPFGHADYFRCVPGGVALSSNSFSAVLADYCDSFLDHGLNRLLIMNGHGGNRPLVDAVTRKIRERTGLAIPSINLWTSIPDHIWEEAHPGFGRAAAGHGGDPIASLYLYLFPGLVRTDRFGTWPGNNTFNRLPVSSMASVDFEGVAVNLPLNVDDLNDQGMTGGDTRKASAEAGKIFFDFLTGYISRFAEEYWQNEGS